MPTLRLRPAYPGCGNVAIWKRALAHDTEKYRLGILRMTSRHGAFMHGARDIAVGMLLRRPAEARGPRDRSSEILSAGQLGRLLSFLRGRDPLLHAWRTLFSSSSAVSARPTSIMEVQ